MQSAKIPVSVDPVKAAAKKLDYEGIADKNDLTRLAGMVDAILEDARVRISFFKNESGLNVFEGSVSLKVSMICQRCLERMEIPLEAEFRYTPDVKLVRQLGLENDFDDAELNSFGEVLLYDIIEDELILSLPLIAKHPLEECPARELLESLSSNETEQERYSPFQALGDLIKSKNN